MLDVDNSSNNGDIFIEISKKNKPFPEDYYLIDKENAYFHKKNVALYEVSRGNKIEIYLYKNVELTDAFQHLLNFPIALCLYQKDFIILHASAVEYENKVLLFCGQSHSGKSTISNFFTTKGAKLITDDISAIKFVEGNCFVETSFNYQKLTKNYISNLNTKPQRIINIESKDNERVGYKSDLSKKNTHKIDYCFFIDCFDYKIQPANNNIIINNLLKFMYVSKREDDYIKLLDFAKSIEFYNLGYRKEFSFLEKILKDISEIISKSSHHS